jgi:DtxR family transcriptional regulator, Mn-dependent transcriptional regulator
VEHSDADLLRYLSELHIRLGDRIEVLQRTPIGGPLIVRVGSPPDDIVHALGDELVAAISIEVGR